MATSPIFLLFRLLVLGGVIGIAAALAFGFMGRMHPALDSFSHFRIHLAVLAIMAALALAALRFWPEAVFALLLGVASIAATIGPFSPTSAILVPSAFAEPTVSPVYRLLHMNLRFDNQTPEKVFAAIEREAPDVITMNEVSSLWAERLPVLDDAYPYRIICPPPSPIGGVAILSTRPFVLPVDDTCGDRGSFISVDVDFDGRHLDVVAMHLGWPWPFGQSRHVERIEDDLPLIGDTAILAGDFNAVPWSNTVRRVAEIGGLRIVRGIGPTWLSFMLPNGLRPYIGLPIDNILVKGGVIIGSAKTLSEVGSDHLPILVEFTLPPQAPRRDTLQAALSGQ